MSSHSLLEPPAHDDASVDELAFAPLDVAGTQLPLRFVAAAYERRSLRIASHRPATPGAAPSRRTPPPRCSTGSCTTPSSSSPKARARMREEDQRSPPLDNPRHDINYGQRDTGAVNNLDTGRVDR